MHFIKPEGKKPTEPLESSSAPQDLLTQMAEIKHTFQVVENSNAELKAKIENLEAILRKFNQ
jgi:hypothetical protein